MVVETHTGLREQPTRAMSRPEQPPEGFPWKGFSTTQPTCWQDDEDLDRDEDQDKDPGDGCLSFSQFWRWGFDT